MSQWVEDCGFGCGAQVVFLALIVAACSTSTILSGVLPHPGMFPSGISIASPDMFPDASNYPLIAAGGGVPLTRGVPT